MKVAQVSHFLLTWATCSRLYSVSRAKLNRIVTEAFQRAPRPHRGRQITPPEYLATAKEPNHDNNAAEVIPDANAAEMIPDANAAEEFFNYQPMNGNDNGIVVNPEWDQNLQDYASNPSILANNLRLFYPAPADSDGSELITPSVNSSLCISWSKCQYHYHTAVCFGLMKKSQQRRSVHEAWLRNEFLNYIRSVSNVPVNLSIHPEPHMPFRYLIAESEHKSQEDLDDFESIAIVPPDMDLITMGSKKHKPGTVIDNKRKSLLKLEKPRRVDTHDITCACIEHDLRSYDELISWCGNEDPAFMRFCDNNFSTLDRIIKNAGRRSCADAENLRSKMSARDILEEVHHYHYNNGTA